MDLLSQIILKLELSAVGVSSCRFIHFISESELSASFTNMDLLSQTVCWSRNCRLSALMVNLLIVSESRYCLLSAALTCIYIWA